MFGASGPQMISLAVVAVIAMAVFRREGSGGPVLVLQEFDQTRSLDGTLVRIRGRRIGVIAYILALVGLDASISLTVSVNAVEIRLASLHGLTTHQVPIAKISSTHAGYSRPVNLLILAGLILIGGAGAAAGVSGGFAGVLLGATVTIELVLLVAYSLGKTIRIAVETTGGMVFAIRYKGSFIEGKIVDIDAARAVCRLIGELGMGAVAEPASRTGHSEAKSARDKVATIYCGHCGMKAAAARIGELCPRCGVALD